MLKSLGVVITAYFDFQTLMHKVKCEVLATLRKAIYRSHRDKHNCSQTALVTSEILSSSLNISHTYLRHLGVLMIHTSLLIPQF